MSDASRRTRRDRIESIAQSRGKTGQHYVHFWVTRGRAKRARDGSPGPLDDCVAVWLRRPDRIAYPDGEVRWFAEIVDKQSGELCSALFAAWTLPGCDKTVGTRPDDDRQCLRREGAALGDASILARATA